VGSLLGGDQRLEPCRSRLGIGSGGIGPDLIADLEQLLPELIEQCIDRLEMSLAGRGRALAELPGPERTQRGGMPGDADSL
jgi:hypothetical protein